MEDQNDLVDLASNDSPEDGQNEGRELTGTEITSGSVARNVGVLSPDVLSRWVYYYDWWWYQNLGYIYRLRNKSRIRPDGRNKLQRDPAAYLRNAAKAKLGLTKGVNVVKCSCKRIADRPLCGGNECILRGAQIHCMRCSDGCVNNEITRGLLQCLRFRAENTSQIVLYTTEAISADTLIVEFVGEVTADLPRMNAHHVIQLTRFINQNDLLFLDANTYGNESRQIQHSEQPNCYIQEWFVQGDVRAIVVAHRDIEAGETLTLNYALRSPHHCHKIPTVAPDDQMYPVNGPYSPPQRPRDEAHAKEIKLKKFQQEERRRLNIDEWGVPNKPMLGPFPNGATGIENRLSAEPPFGYPDADFLRQDGFRNVFWESDAAAEAAATDESIEQNRARGLVGIPSTTGKDPLERVNIENFREPPNFRYLPSQPNPGSNLDSVRKYHVDMPGTFICRDTNCYFRADDPERMLEHTQVDHAAHDPVRSGPRHPSRQEEDLIWIEGQTSEEMERARREKARQEAEDQERSQSGQADNSDNQEEKAS